MNARDTVRAYYDALRAGDPLDPFFTRGREAADKPVKFGVSETLAGLEDIEDGLREQTKTTADWVVDSRTLRVSARERTAWFSDAVGLSWTDVERGVRFEFETRWSGTLLRVGDEGDDSARPGDERGGSAREGAAGDDPTWQFVGMHVSTADEF